VMRSTVKGGKSSVSRHSIVISDRKTSVSLEDEFWDGLKESAVARNIKLYTLVTKIDSKRQQANLSSAIRLFVLDFYRRRRGHQLRRPTFSLVERKARKPRRSGA
jgi:predicted DNA-binding ribbon-helix-helix protein